MRIKQILTRQTNRIIPVTSRVIRCPRVLEVTQRNHLTRKSRFLSSSPFRQPENENQQQQPQQNDLIKHCIKQMMEERQQIKHEHLLTSKTPTIADGNLEGRIHHFQSLLEEAQLCISDCESEKSWNKEIDMDRKEAVDAVEKVFGAYVDLLDDLRNASEAQKNRYQELRQKSATLLRQLRYDLERVVGKIGSNSV